MKNKQMEQAARIPEWLKLGTRYYIPDISHVDMYIIRHYIGSRVDKTLIANSLVFQTKEEAIEATKKMLKAVEEISL